MKPNTSQQYLLEVRKLYGSWIKQIREEKKQTQQQMADEIGMSRSTIAKIENGKWNFGIDTLTIFAQQLDFFLFFLEKSSKDELADKMRDRWKRAHEAN